VKPPRSVFLRWPFGHPLGEPFNQMQQRTVVLDCLEHLYAIRTPGAIIDLPYVWRRHDFLKESSQKSKE
jgi:D-proline reductase (dithiol) PrdB